MSREEAAAKAIYVHNKAEGIDGFPADEYDCCAKEALAAADAHDAAHGVHRVGLDDATVERAARALMGQWECEPYVLWLGASDAICETHETDWVADNQCCANALDAARAVLAATVEAGQ